MRVEVTCNFIKQVEWFCVNPLKNRGICLKILENLEISKHAVISNFATRWWQKPLFI